MTIVFTALFLPVAWRRKHAQTGFNFGQHTSALSDEPREFNLPTLPQRCITYEAEKLPSKYGVHSEELYKVISKPILLHGSEDWSLTINEERRLEAAQMRLLRPLLEVSRRDCIRNDYIGTQLGEANILQQDCTRFILTKQTCDSRAEQIAENAKNLNQVTCRDREWNLGHLVSRPDALTHSLKWVKGKRSRPLCPVVQQEEVESIPASILSSSYECTIVQCVLRGALQDGSIVCEECFSPTGDRRGFREADVDRRIIPASVSFPDDQLMTLRA
ncbi:hypothetical protein ANN_14226 [Periplaneta americana]|uniref:Uncharacterized protein n=1 Tax=Periplaneta americana TaxID=6978 RepID=A0ABQ8SX91_PERAM|nr:hypothetical protein ANN_14226 [Periplaneta americana]